jgi:molecular chaperone IbpA
MNSLDFTPLYRSAIGFDRLAQLMDNALRSESQPSYPPYNIELTEKDKYRITMAVAGFNRSELDIEVEQDALKIVGRKERPANRPRSCIEGLRHVTSSTASSLPSM